MLYSKVGLIKFNGVIEFNGMSCDDVYLQFGAKVFNIVYCISVPNSPLPCDGILINMPVDNDFGYQIYCGMNGDACGRARYSTGVLENHFTPWKYFTLSN